SGRAERAKFFGTRPASTGLVVRRLADPAMLIEVELVVDLGGAAAGKPLLDKYNAENHGGDFYQGVIVNGGRPPPPARPGPRTTPTARSPASATGGVRRKRSTRTSATCCGPPARRRRAS